MRNWLVLGMVALTLAMTACERVGAALRIIGVSIPLDH